MKNRTLIALENLHIILRIVSFWEAGNLRNKRDIYKYIIKFLLAGMLLWPVVLPITILDLIVDGGIYILEGQNERIKK